MLTAAPPLRNVNILVVDDQEDQLRTFSEILDDPSYRIVTARSGGDALRELLTNNVAVVLLDVLMDGIDGFETARLIRERKRTREVPIIFLTGLELTGEKIAEASRVGAADYVLKPVDADLLRTKVRTFVKLYQAREELETLVQKRTEELLRTNEALRQEVVERQRTQEGLRFLSEASALLASSLDFETTLANIAAMAVPRLADWAAVDFVDEGGAVRRVTTVHRDPAKLERARAYHLRRPPTLDDPHGIGAVLRTGQTEFTPWIPDLLPQSGGWHPDEKRLIEDLSLRSVVIVPAKSRGKVLGAITLISSESERRYGAPDVVLAEELARRASLALENARLYGEARRELEERKKAQEALRLVADAANLFSESQLELPDLMGGLLKILVPAVADACYVRRLSSDGRQILTIAARHRDPELERREREVTAAPQPADQGMTGEVLRAGKVVFMPTVDAEEFRESTAEQYRSYVNRSRMGSFLMVPMRAQGRIAGALGVARQIGREPFTREDLALVQSIADRAGLALATWDAFQLLAAEKDTSAHLASIVRSSNDAIVTKTLEGTITTWNAAAERMFGFAAGEVIGRSITVIIPDDRVGEERMILEKIAQGGAVEHYETVRRRKDGTLLQVSLTISPVRDPSGRVIGASKISRDITERKRAEEEIRRLNSDLENRVRERTAELEGMVRELDTFAYTVAHDLRAPLRAVHGLGQILLEDHAGQLDEEGKGYLARMIDAGSRMDVLIRDLLSYSRLSREDIDLRPLDLEGIVDQVLRDLEGELAERRAEVRVERPIPRALGHAVTLGQAVANLVSNAAKFVAPGVEPRIVLRAETLGGWVRLWVEDNGIGIAPEHQFKLFRVFERLHGQDAYPGTGIGLAIVRRAVERMAGNVGVESAPGRGSRFYVELRPARES